MADLVLGSYLFRYPLGGMASWVLQYLDGFVRLGHDVWFVERADHHGACFDPTTGSMGDDPAVGIDMLAPHLDRIGLRGRWCMVDVDGRHHGMTPGQLAAAFDRADAFLDMGTHGAFAELAGRSGLRVLLDGEPGFTQVRLERARREGNDVDTYDRYFTTGAHVGRPGSDVPTAGLRWEHLWHPVVAARHEPAPPPPGAPFTTVMNWRSHREVELDGAIYGQKDRSFARFESLPGLVDVPAEVAVSGIAAGDAARLRGLGWRVVDGQAASATVERFERYLRSSAGEIAIAKHAFVEHRTGWFSDRSALFLAMGRPVVVQDTGICDVLPCGDGLVAVSDAEEAADAIRRIAKEPDLHAAAARRVAVEELDVSVVLPRFLRALGLVS